MNCANHPDVLATAFCQNCGKPLCAQCVRSVGGLVFCEQCLSARLNLGGPAQKPGAGAAAGSAAGAAAGASGWNAVPNAGAAGYVAGIPERGVAAHPAIAALLGFIPGVGAMYNGQFIKALVHVLVLMVLIGMANHFELAGLLIAFWVFYQVFDSVQTALARRDGRPLPDLLGLNNLGARLGISQPPVPQAGGSPYGASPYGQAASAPGVAAEPTAYAAPASSTSEGTPAASPEGYAQTGGTTAAGFAPGPASGSPPQPGSNYNAPGYIPPGYVAPQVYPVAPSRAEPTGAIVLIVVGLLFLLSTFGVFEMDWIGRGWPVIVIVVGVWLLIRRARTQPGRGDGR